MSSIKCEKSLQNGGVSITVKNKAFVKKARKRMIDLDMNDCTLAKKIGVSKSYISLMFLGKRNLTDEIKERIKTELGI